VSAVFATKSYADRLRAAIALSDKQTDPERAVFIMKQALEKEIKLVEAIQNTAGFAAWIGGERFDLATIRARKK
jgi:hypothetical protein